MKLAEWARTQGISYQTAYRWFKAGQLPVPAYQVATGTIIVEATPVRRNPAEMSVVQAHPQASPAMTREFHRLVGVWKKETELSSMPDIQHPAYQRIIHMGSPAIGLLLGLMKDASGAQWHPALQSITGVNPLHKADAGYLPRVAERWRAWGVQHGYPQI